MWETVAREKDPFICMNLIAPMLDELTEAGLPFKNLGEIHKYIEEFILGKQNEVIHKVRQKFLLSEVKSPQIWNFYFSKNQIFNIFEPREDSVISYYLWPYIHVF